MKARFNLSTQYFWVILFLFVVSFSNAQFTSLKLEQYNTDDGLSQNQVYSMVQDRQGFIWLATDEGLNRFDGYEFKIFRHVATDSTTISDNSIHSLLIDHTGLLWIGTNNGVTQYNHETEKFNRLPIDYYDIEKLNGNAVNTIREDKKGKIWIAYLGSGVDVIIPGQKEILHYTVHRQVGDPYRIMDDYVIDLEFLPNEEAVLVTRNGLIFLKADGKVMEQAESLKKYPWKKKIDQSVKCTTIADHGRKLWLGTELNGVLMVDLRTSALHLFNTANGQLLFNNNVPAIMEDHKRRVWIGGEAIYLYDSASNGLIPFNEFGMRNNVETKNPILSIFEDRDNNIWFGTFRLGALQFSPRRASMLHFHAMSGRGSLSNNNVLSFIQDENQAIWVGTDGGGLNRLSDDGTSFIVVPLSNRFSSQVIKCLYLDKGSNFWMGTWDGGMMRYHPSSNELEIFNPDHKNFPSRHVWDIKADRSGNLWIGTLRDGVCYFEPQTKKFTFMKNDPSDSSSLINNDVLALFIDSQNTLWVGTADGVSVLRSGSQKFVNIHKKGNLSNALCFFEDGNNRMWIGTNGGGVVVMDRNLKAIKILNEGEGLPSPTICSIVADDHGQVWVSTYNGLCKINPNDFTIFKIPTAGLQGKEFISRSSLKTIDGKLLFGGVNGFNMFHPDSLGFSKEIPQVYFTSLQIQGQEIKPGQYFNERKILNKSISLTDHITFGPDDNSITLTFSPLLFNLQNNIRYSYKLENFDADWQYTDATKRFIHYTSLDPGKYTLLLKTSADGVVWPKHARALSITVTPPWWATIWVRTITIILSISLLVELYKTRVRFHKNRQIKLERMVTERTQELTASNREIQALLKAVEEQKHEIEEKNHELLQVNDAVVHQRDDLEVKGWELERARVRLKEINTNLEALVDKRTQKLSNTLRELETFLYRASHDLRGPISSMLGILNITELEKDNEQLKKTYSEMFHKSVLQLDRTLQTLLLRHTLERRKLVNEVFAKADLEIFIWEINRAIPSFRIDDFEVIIDSDVLISIDRLILKTILASLLENAFFYSVRSEDRLVSLEIKSNNGEHSITVSDRGAGIRPDQQEKIFEMFYRGHELSTGNGLGLYMVQSALEKINGRISFESELGKYSIFRVAIPK